MSDRAPPRCWVITDGKPGMENQCVGLAERLGLTPHIKRVALRTPWRQLVPYLRVGLRWAVSPAGDPVTPPWPDLVIASGRASIAPALRARRASGGRCLVVYIQNPAIATHHFDLVIAPNHDGLLGPGVVSTLGAVHRVTAQKLAAEAREWEMFAQRPGPRVAVLVGGNNGVYRLTPAITTRLADQLATLAASGASVLVTPSRRTGAENEAVLREKLAPFGAYVWDGNGPNPYFGMLAHADAIIATCDSVSMVSEACSTGKPVHVIELEGGNGKFRSFLSAVYDRGCARPFTGQIEHWSYAPLDDTSEAAGAVAQLLRARGFDIAALSGTATEELL
jgi:uncharacterized protein